MKAESVECGFHEPKGDGPGPVRPDSVLLAAGWTARFLVEASRAAEMTGLYLEAGFEAQAVAVRPKDFDERCGNCPSVVCRNYLLIYTRPHASA